MASIASSPLKQLVYLHGAPGTGKTRFVGETGRCLGLPVETLRITSTADLEQLLPRNGSFDSTDYIWSGEAATDQTICGSILYAILVHGTLNPIVHIDEGSALLGGRFGSGLSVDSVKDALKMLFDDTVTRLAAPTAARDFKFDFSRVTIIVSSNRSLSDGEVDPALISRLVSYQFGSMTRNVRLAAAGPCLDDLTCEPFNANQQRKVTNQTRAHIPEIVDRSMREGYEGAREVIRAVRGVWAVYAHAELMQNPKGRVDVPMKAAKIKACIEAQMPERIRPGQEHRSQEGVGGMSVSTAEGLGTTTAVKSDRAQPTSIQVDAASPAKADVSVASSTNGCAISRDSAQDAVDCRSMLERLQGKAGSKKV